MDFNGMLRMHQPHRPMLQRDDDGKQLLLVHTPSVLSVAQFLTDKSDWSQLSAVIALRQHSADCVIRRVCMYNEWQRVICNCKHGTAGDGCLQLIEGCACAIIPLQWCGASVLQVLEQVEQRCSCPAETVDEVSEGVCEAKETPHLSLGARHRPLSHCLNL